MIAATTAMTSPEVVSFPTPRRSKPWKPDATDQLIFSWVKFEGKRQSWVASELNIHQGTVSRTIERYEKWLAHAQPGADGTLDQDERLRAQRWLTYQRNEIILASALRIAGEMEGFTDVTKTVTSRRNASTTDEREMRTEYGVLDRSGVASRFLRLAFRINMEQLKLVEMAPLAPLAPLAADAFDEDEDDDENDAEREDRAEGEDEDENQPAMESDERERVDKARPESSACVADGPRPAPQEPSPPSAHNAHNWTEPESGASAETADGCIQIPRRRKKRLARINGARHRTDAASEPPHPDALPTDCVHSLD